MSVRKRIAYDAGFKLQVVKFAEECQNNRLTAREFNIGEKLVRDWRKAAPKLATIPRSKKACRGLKTQFVREEKQLKEWLISLRQSGYIVTRAAIRLKAKEFIQNPRSRRPLGGVQSSCAEIT
jgi:transposase-like protein